MPLRPTSAPARRSAYGIYRDPKNGLDLPVTTFSGSILDDPIKPANTYARRSAAAAAAASDSAYKAAKAAGIRAGRTAAVQESVWEELDLHRSRLQMRLEAERRSLADERDRERHETERLLEMTRLQQAEEKAATDRALEEAKLSLEKQSEERVSRARREFMDIEGVLRERAQQEVDDARHRMQAEIDEWKAVMVERFDASLEASKAATARHLARRREKELDTLLSKLVEETVSSETRMKEEYERRLAAAEDRHAVELGAAVDESKEWQHKYASLRAKQARLERELADAADAVKAADWEARIATMQAREKKVKEALEKALSSKEERVSELEKRNTELSADVIGYQRRLREQAGELEMEYNDQLSSYKRRKEQDLELLQSRIRATIHRKDSNIAELRARLQQAESSMAKREEALQASCQALLSELS